MGRQTIRKTWLALILGAGLFPLSTQAGLVAAESLEAELNAAPVWTGTPQPVATAGVSSSYAVNSFYSDADGDTLTLALAGGCSLPTGVTIDDLNKEIDFSASTVASTTTDCQLSVDDGSGAVLSPAFTIDITGSGEPSATITVCQSGCDFTSGQAAYNSASAGDVIEYQANSPGGTRSFQENLLLGANDGTEDDLITIRGRAGDTVILYATSGFILEFDDLHYVRFKNLQFGRDQTLNGWGYATDEGRLTVEHSQWLHSNNDPSSHIIFEDTVSYGGSFFDGGLVDLDGSYYAYIRHEYKYAGINAGGNNPNLGGNTLSFRGSNSIFISVDGRFGGHDNLSIESPYIAVMNSMFDGSWTLHNGTSNPGRGNRAFTNEGSKGASPYGPNVIEGNVIRNSDQDLTGGGDPCMKGTGFGNIIRRNYLYDCVGGAAYKLTGLNAPGVAATDYIQIYNNTEDNNLAVIDSSDSNLDAAANGFYKELDYSGNLVTNLGAGDDGDGSHIRVIRSNSSNGGYPDDWRGSRITDNTLHVQSGGFKTRLGLGAAVGASNNETTVALAEAEWPAVMSGNSTAAVTYQALGDRTSDDYATAIAAFQPVTPIAGPPATLADGAGTNATQLTVDNSRRFVVFDDPATWNFRWFIERGYIYEADCVQVDGTAPVRIDSLDHSQNRLILESPRTWTNNSDVYLVDGWDCTTVIDARGAAQ